MVASKRLAHSFRHALRGLVYAWKQERNFRIQIAAAIIVLALTLLVPLRTWEVTVILLLIFMVLTLELFNTVVERLLDAHEPRLHHYVEELKDLMAAAVLLASCLAVIVGAIIFLPKLW